ncbi:MAG: NAD-dependent epimerase/dehydratase family protein [Ardenticatenaceae bacterium]|nr:NAD-dependent epimerase/dehydratase family protein [Ardenticatenaceae bacterium]
MILITGATGFIGRSLTNRLTLEEREWKAYIGHINDQSALQEQLQGVDTVIHLAGTEWRSRTRLLRSVDWQGTERLLRECRRAQIKNLILLSRTGADPYARHLLPQIKGHMERMVEKSNIPYTIIRSASVYGRGDRYFEMLLALAIWTWPFVWLPRGGDMLLQPLWVEDLARCLAMTVERPDLLGQTITIAGEEQLSYREVMRLILQTAEIRRIPLKIPILPLRYLARLLFRWWYWPPISEDFMDRLFIPELTRHDAVFYHFGFRPARIRDTLAYLHRPRMRWRLFRQ